MACKKALERLKRARETDKECIKYNICPACGGSLTKVGGGPNIEIVCMPCGKYYGDDQEDRYAC